MQRFLGRVEVPERMGQRAQRRQHLLGDELVVERPALRLGVAIDDPPVAVRELARFGLDGFRVDAVPYLIEREGTPCENLPETHAFLRRLRYVIDVPFPDFAARRAAMVRDQIEDRGVHDPRVLQAMREVPRERFVRPGWQAQACDDNPLPIEAGQTISQPYIVAFMAEALQLQGGERVLEIGTGCGYQAALLAQQARRVVSIERLRALHDKARDNLERRGSIIEDRIIDALRTDRDWIADVVRFVASRRRGAMAGR